MATLRLAVTSTLTLNVAVAASLQSGCNIQSVTYYDEDLKFCDLVKMGSPFGLPGGPWKGNAPLDNSTGWPTADFSIMLADVAPVAAFFETFKVTGTAAAAPTVAGVACAVTVVNSTYDPATGDFTAYVEANVSGLLTLSFTGTSGGVRGLRVWRSSCGADPAAAVFHPDFLQNLAGRCSLLRFLDFEAINDATIVDWADRVPPSWPQWGGGLRPYGGAPWEAAIALANAVGADMWVQVPLTASDAYVTSLAGLLLADLASNATIYTEFSNEVWNDGFEQEHQQVAAANASVAAGDPLRLDYDGCGNQWYWAHRLTAYQAAVRLPSLFASVFGDAAVGAGKRVRPVLAGQVAWTFPLEEGIGYLSARSGWDAQPPAKLHAFAGAPYFGCGSGCAAARDVPSVLALVAADIASLAPAAGWGANQGLQQTATLSAWYRVPLLGYEGGPDFSAGGLNYSLTGAAQRDATFAGLTTTYLQTWAAYGTNGRLNQYTAGASDWSQQYGCWGTAERIAAKTSTKLAGMDAAHAAPRPANALGVPIPTLGLPAGYFSGCNAANASSAGPLGLHNGSSVLYPVNLWGQEPGRSLVVSLAAASASTGSSSSSNVFSVGLNGDASRSSNTTVPGSVSFLLSADDVGLSGGFGGASAVQLTLLTPGAYAVVANVSFTVQ